MKLHMSVMPEVFGRASIKNLDCRCESPLRVATTRLNFKRAMNTKELEAAAKEIVEPEDAKKTSENI